MNDTQLYLREWRLIRRMTQEKLAEKADLRRATINDIERGRTNPSDESLQAILRALRLKERHLKRDPFARFEAVGK